VIFLQKISSWRKALTAQSICKKIILTFGSTYKCEQFFSIMQTTNRSIEPSLQMIIWKTHCGCVLVRLISKWITLFIKFKLKFLIDFCLLQTCICVCIRAYILHTHTTARDLNNILNFGSQFQKVAHAWSRTSF